MSLSQFLDFARTKIGQHKYLEQATQLAEYLWALDFRCAPPYIYVEENSVLFVIDGHFTYTWIVDNEVSPTLEITEDGGIVYVQTVRDIKFKEVIPYDD